MLEEARSRERSNQMMIIVSDGRGVLTDGADRIVKVSDLPYIGLCLPMHII